MSVSDKMLQNNTNFPESATFGHFADMLTTCTNKVFGLETNITDVETAFLYGNFK